MFIRSVMMVLVVLYDVLRTGPQELLRSKRDSNKMVPRKRMKSQLHEERSQVDPLVVIKHKLQRRRDSKADRRVKFSDCSELIGWSSSDEISAAWYSLAELLSFKTEVKRLSKACLATMLPHRLAIAQPAFVASSTCNTDEDNLRPYKTNLFISPRNGVHSNIPTRGLEYQCCYERQRRTTLGREVLLRLATKVEASRLSQIAVNCNAWAPQLAVEQAIEDAAAAGSPFDIDQTENE